MTAMQLLSYLGQRKVKISVRDDHLELSNLGDSLTPEIRATLSSRKQEIIAILRSLKGSSDLTVAKLHRRERAQGLPLSFAQQRLWFLDQLVPNSAFYNIPMALRLEGSLDQQALQRSLDALVARHETLRTTFSQADGTPFQLVGSAKPAALTVVELSHLSPEQRESEAQALAEEEAMLPFDLSQGPLLRVTLLRLDSQDQVLLITIHHIISDGWSLGVLNRELAALYAAFADNRPSPLPELPIQYADFAVWQRQWLTGMVLEEQLSYWKQRLQNLPTLQMPTDYARPAVQSFRGAVSTWQFPEELARNVHEFSRNKGVTLFMTLLAAFQVLLHHCSGQDDIVLGSPIAGRIREEIEGLIGCFVNVLVMRGDLSADPIFLELLHRTRDGALEAYEHQGLPFEKLVEELDPERDPSRNPLCQISFAVQNMPTSEVELPRLTVRAMRLKVQSTRLDLETYVFEDAAGLNFQVVYNTSLFSASTVERLYRRYVRLLEQVLDDPQRRIGAISILDEEERRLVLEEWNRTATAYPRDSCAHALFEAQVEKTPHAPALLFGSAQLSYRELNSRANRVAHRLRRLGVGPETLVGLSAQRSAAMIVGFLAILKAGGAYVPLDPEYPLKRLKLMIEDSGLGILLADGPSSQRLPECEAAVLSLDAAPQDNQESTENPDSGVGPRNLAYVIYTSGSTGKPKGVMVEHRGLCNLSEAQVRVFGVQPEERVLQFASLSFDASIFEIMMALRAGAALCLGTREELLPGANLIEFVRQRSISLVVLPPSALAVSPDAELPELRTITVAGEACPPDLVARWAKGRRFYNLYGPTEATVWTTYCQCTDASRRPPIGRPVANTKVYVLDGRMQPVPVGVPGELYIGGEGLARGYLNRPELTAERFVADPFEAGARLYRSGDLARWLAHGEIEFLGRMDEQVKLRGYRIELGEIEAALSEHPGVLEAVVVVRRERLVGYVMGRGGEPDLQDLRAYLRERLPEYMIPSAFVALAQLPLTPNGKVDRAALPEPQATQPQVEYREPRTELQKAIAGVWEEVLKLERVGLADNFFDVGGHSLLVTQVHSRLQRLLGREIPVVELFRYPTVGALCEHLGEGVGEPEGLEDSLDRARRQRQAIHWHSSRQSQAGGRDG